MNRRLLGWFPTLAIVAIIGIAISMNAWTSALIMLVPAIVSMPVRWKVRGLRMMPADSMEKGAMCLVLALLGAVSLGAETAADKKAEDVAEKRVTSHQTQNDNARSNEGGEPGESGSGQAGGYSTAPPLAQQAHAETVRMAIDTARSCDSAHREAAGAVRRISTSPPTQETRAAVAMAVESCETSWIIFNRPELRDEPAPENSGTDAKGMAACDQGYLGRWLANDNLLGALDRGMPTQTISQIERINSRNDAAVNACADMLKNYEAQSS